MEAPRKRAREGGDEADRDPRLASLLSWAKGHGARFDRIEFVRAESEPDDAREEGIFRSVVAAEDIAARESICTIPLSIIFTPQRAMETDVAKAILACEEVQKPVELRALFYAVMISQRADESAHWHPYFAVLPEKFCTPLWFSERERKWLAGTNVFASLPSMEQELRASYNKLFPTLSNAMPALFPLEHFTFTSFLWAHTVVRSRAFPLRLSLPHACISPGGPSTGSGPGSAYSVLEDTLSGSQEEKEIGCLLPIMDMLNHDPSADITWSTSEDSLSFVSNSGVAQGGPALNNYGPKSNEELLVGYGFCLADNKSEQMAFKFSADEAAFLSRGAALRTLGIDVQHRDALRQHISKAAVTPEFFAVARALFMPLPDLESVDITSRETFFSIWPCLENEKQVFSTLLQSFREKRKVLLRKAPRSFLLDGSSSASRDGVGLEEQFCNMYRRGQVEVLDVGIHKLGVYLCELNEHFRAHATPAERLFPFPCVRPTLSSPSLPQSGGPIRLKACIGDGVFASVATQPIARGDTIHVYTQDQCLSLEAMTSPEFGSIAELLRRAMDSVDLELNDVQVAFLCLLQQSDFYQGVSSPQLALATSLQEQLHAANSLPFPSGWPAELRAQLDSTTLDALKESEQEIEDLSFVCSPIEAVSGISPTRENLRRAMQLLRQITHLEDTEHPTVLLEANALRHHEFPNAEILRVTAQSEGDEDLGSKSPRFLLRALRDIAPCEEILVSRGSSLANSSLLVNYGYVLPGGGFHSTVTLEIEAFLPKDVFSRIGKCLHTWHMVAPRPVNATLGVPRTLHYAFVIAALDDQDLETCIEAVHTGQCLRTLPCILAKEDQGRALLKARLKEMAEGAPPVQSELAPLQVRLLQQGSFGLCSYASHLLQAM